MTEIEAGPSDSRSLLRKRFEADFTFKPKISSNSQKLTENMTSDFLTRQQIHIEKQKKHYEQALQSSESLLDRPRRVRLSYAGSSQPQQAANSDSSDDQSNNEATTGGSGKNKKQKKTKQQQQQSVLDSQPPGDIPRPSAEEPKKRSRSLPPKANKKAQQQESPTDKDDADSDRNAAIPTTRRRRSSAGGLGGGSISDQRLRKAKELAEEAMRDKKIFSILGPYPRVRDSLRARGWVEKFFIKDEEKQQTLRRSMQGGGATGRQASAAAADDDDDGDGDGDGDDMGDGEEGKVPPWEEEGGFYGLMSRLVRNCQPTLIWSLRKDQVDFKFLRRDQLVNHFGKAGCFTTKIGLSRSLRELPWFHCESADAFYPRCYVLSSEEEKEAFKDDYRITACMSLLRLVGEDAILEPGSIEQDDASEAETKTEGQSETAKSSASAAAGGGGGSPKKSAADASPAKGGHHKDVKRIAPKIQFKSPRPATDDMVAKSVLETAITQCEQLIQNRNHDNLDDWDTASCMSESDWYSFLQSYYRVAHHGARIRDAESLKSRCRQLCTELRSEYPQFDIDGCRNAWIVKPGAKSRGRGIFCVRTLESVLELLRQPSAVGVTPNKLVVQKYIERPLLVHRTKFDIRQWFVVTDFNPLTIWWYKDCYVRFCSQHFTLNDFNEAVHLSNNSIQYKYINQADRHPDLPDDNIWDCISLQTHLSSIGQPDVYYDVIYPGMQKAVINSMLCSQDHVEMRKNCFELYGADFMIDENFRPWLLEINCSPTMAPSTEVTTRLCRNVQDDILKVVVDRRQNRACNTGRFELIYKQQQVNAPTYAGVDLTLLGQAVKRPWNASITAPKPERSVSLFAEERRLERERLAALANQRQPAAAATDDSSTSGQSGGAANGHVTKSVNPKLASVANRKQPTKVEIIPINTGLPKKPSNQPSYFRSKTTSYIPGRPLGGFQQHHHRHHHHHQQQQVSIVEAYPPAPPPPPPPIRSSGGRPSSHSRLIMPAAQQVNISHRYSHRNA
ncbi:hypothetical protein BOX15_Mlig017329g2 [Macrostomum lignano]|uniref:Tubulin--tyrosine ligase-like protein 9 n=2 Tax=Macrostomum lignano TaxID=282301 RepID=A0A267H6M3_9PLAT|nr:hypothetical protein BOX15_Mlig017329g2 [Macrostomum lignano]